MRGRLLQLVDRVGLAEPTHLCLSICIIAYTYYKQIENNSDTWTIFIKMRALQDVFVGAVQRVIAGEQSTSVLLTAKCDNSHVFVGTLLHKMFNCFVKNALKRMNECTTPTSKEATFRKVRKLQSEKWMFLFAFIAFYCPYPFVKYLHIYTYTYTSIIRSHISFTYYSNIVGLLSSVVSYTFRIPYLRYPWSSQAAILLTSCFGYGSNTNVWILQLLQGSIRREVQPLWLTFSSLPSLWMYQSASKSVRRYEGHSKSSRTPAK